jgi:hypothetical protein
MRLEFEMDNFGGNLSFAHLCACCVSNADATAEFNIGVHVRIARGDAPAAGDVEEITLRVARCVDVNFKQDK